MAQQEVYRQGDVLIIRIGAIPANAVPAPATDALILAHGEVTGHAHVLEAPSIQPYTIADKTDQVFFALMQDAFITHQEHAPVALQAGRYQVVRQREYSPSEIRRVAD